jgi:mannosyl-oligosaccharide alpha-1,2-mannosidase
MGQKDIVNQIIDYIPTINYFNTSTEVSLFETTIRYLGGMLSAYDFLSGPLADLADNVRAQSSGQSYQRHIMLTTLYRKQT